MPRFEPFAALRYRSDLSLDAVCAPPYDVLSEADLDRLEARHARNIVHLDVPRERQGPGRYEAAAQRLADWLADGTLVRDPAPSFTIYRRRFVSEQGEQRETVGVLGGLEVVDEAAGGVLPHERVTPKASTDRLDLTRATRANLSPVWGLSLREGLTDLLRAPGTALGETTDETGVVHIVERVEDESRCAAIADAVAAAPVVIADGHHRYGIGRTYRDERRGGPGGDAGPAELTLTFVAELVEDQLDVAAIHRLYRGPDLERLRDHLSARFDVSEAGRVDRDSLATMAERGCCCLVTPDGNGAWLQPRPDAFSGVRDLDSSRLERAMDGLDHEVAYQHGVEEVLTELERGDWTAAVLIGPVTVAEIQRTADEGLLMPPKSTFFTPKLRTGLVLREL